MRNVVVCWGPECGQVVAQPKTGRPGRYHSQACKQRAVRRNGGTAPAEPYPPLEPWPLQQDAAAATVAAPPGKPGPAVNPKSEPAPVSPPKPRGKRSASRPSPSTESGPTAESLAPVAHLHVAVTEDSTVPVRVVVHPMVARYKADLEGLGLADTRQGLQVLAMAEKLVSSATSPSAAANLSKELERLMTDLEQNSPAAQAERDPSSVIRERTLAKLRAVAGGKAATA